MKPEDPRDRAVERLLRQSLRADVISPASAECLNAETLAVWADGGLDAADLERVEAHASDCARCRALMSGMVRSAPSAPEVGGRFTWSIRWTVPLAAGLAAAVLWMVVPGRLSSDVAQEQGRLQARAEAPGSAAPALADRLEAPPSAPSQEKAVSALERPADARQSPARVEATGRADEMKAKEVATLDTLAKTASAAKKAADAPKPVPAGQRAEARAAMAAPAPASPPAASAAGEAVGRLRQAGPSEVASPDPQVRWRIGVSGSVEGTRDGGATWEPAAIGIVAELTGGSSPSRSVCWLVGRGGVVVVTSDGQAWRRVPFPEATDLTAVQATDHRTASVVTVDGRSFRTSDGGATWRRP